MEEWTQVPSHPGSMAAAAEEPPSSGLLCTDQFLRAFENFKKCGAPSRFLLLSEEAWMDLPSQVFEELKAGFVAGKSTLEVPMDARSYLFDFLSMSRIDPVTGGQNRIGWIDVHGQCFFPRYAVGENVKRSPGVDKSVSIPTISLKKDLLSMIRAFDPSASITSIRSCVQESKRLAYLRLCKKTPGKPRLCAWYGSSSSNIHNVLSHGFGQCNMGMKGLPLHGYGIHLSPHIYTSAMQSEPDDNGERHMIFCVAIVGNCENVERGSTQDHPSNECYDSGIDDLANPKWYVIWSTNMNTHILPVSIVSFKTPGLSQELYDHCKISFECCLAELDVDFGLQRLPNYSLGLLDHCLRCRCRTVAVLLPWGLFGPFSLLVWPPRLRSDSSRLMIGLLGLLFRLQCMVQILYRHRKLQEL